MKIAATIVLLVAALCVIDGVSSQVSVGETIKSDFLNLDTPAVEPRQAAEGAAEEVIEEGWIDTIRRRRTRRQSRFC